MYTKVHGAWLELGALLLGPAAPAEASAFSNGVPRSAAPGRRVKKRACLSAELVASKKERMKFLHTCAAAGGFAGFAFFAGGGGSDGPPASSSFSSSHTCAAAGGFAFFAGGGGSDGAPAPSSFSSSLPEAASPRRTPEADEEGVFRASRCRWAGRGCVCCEDGCEGAAIETRGDSGGRTAGAGPHA